MFAPKTSPLRAAEDVAEHPLDRQRDREGEQHRHHRQRRRPQPGQEHPLHRHPGHEEQRDGQHQREQRIDPRLPVEVPREVGREDEERGVRDHHHPHDAEVERQPGGQQRVQPAEQQSEDDALQEEGTRHPRLTRPA
jgi:hypothetical protein